MADTRKRYTAKEKEAILASSKCYVCEDLGLEHAGFTGYELKEVHFDHYQTPFGSPGGETTDTLPIHAAPGGSIPDDADFEHSARRNCHRLRSNHFSTRSGYVQVLRARLAARDATYVDDVYENSERNPAERKYRLPVSWGSTTAKFMERDYPVVSENRPTETWRRFLTTLPTSRLFTDDTSQVRPAAHKNLMKMVQTYLVEDFPTFAPVNARVDKCGHVVVFDGNHRATAHALAFGVEGPMPVMIWDIATGDECALRTNLSSTPDKE
jgi:hypothetical protein